MKRVLIISIAILLIFLSQIQTDGFRTDKIIFSDLKSSNGSFDIFSNKFFYLGRGRQYFVFESEDHKYVLKFLNKSNFTYPKILKWFYFLPFIKHIIDRKDHKKDLTFKSMQLSSKNLKDEAKLIFINTVPTRDFPKVILQNKSKVDIKVNLNDTFFVLQRKCDPFFDTLNKMHEINKDEFHKAIDSYLSLIGSRVLKNIADDDLNIETNIGFVEDEAMIIDTGRLYFDEKLKDQSYKKLEFLRSTKLLKKWLEKNYDDELIYLNQRLDSLTL